MTTLIQWGKIRFTGRVVKATCKVATDSKQIEVVLRLCLPTFSLVST